MAILILLFIILAIIAIVDLIFTISGNIPSYEYRMSNRDHVIGAVTTLVVSILCLMFCIIGAE